MRSAFCTITTVSHLPQVRALHHSLSPWLEDIDYVALVVDGRGQGEGITWLELDAVQQPVTGKAICQKYHRPEQQDALRWSLKPVLLHHLLQSEYERVIFLDNDLFFFADPRFLFAHLDAAHLVLTPHWRILNPNEDVHEFRNHFTDGLYNAGFVGANRKAEAALLWWAKACLHHCAKDPARGYFVDQRYLDILPVYFPPVHLVSHRGCNVAYWNRRALPRVLVDGEVRIDGKWPIVFIHFTASLLTEIMETGREMALQPYLDRYLKALEQFRPELALPPVLTARSAHWRNILNFFRRN
ncbi:MAG: hypothetical protein AAGN35_06450 [Bacteroidota bacterium]